MSFLFVKWQLSVAKAYAGSFWTTTILLVKLPSKNNVFLFGGPCFGLKALFLWITSADFQMRCWYRLYFAVKIAMDAYKTFIVCIYYMRVCVLEV